MSTQAQDVLTRALALNVANQAFASGPVAVQAPEILWRLNYAQGQLWTKLAQENRFFWVKQTTLASSSGSSGRTLDISQITAPPVERLLDKGLLLPGGVPLNIVDFQDQDAELAPRGYAFGLVLNEIGSEWGPPGPVTFTVVYVYRPADLLINTDLTQLVTVPDRFTSYLDLDLGIYFNGKDVGRAQVDPTEVQRLTAMQEVVYQDLLQFVDHVIGPAIRRFILPVPAKGEKA
ncbi:MAG TPA: hypothetical protein VEU74_12115 [Gemmatimonadales bacterium]|nr:hypothetical protein [Gemmatimonadales bacterium]